MLTISGKNSYSMSEIQRCWYNAHSAESNPEYATDDDREQLPRIKDLLLTGNTVTPTLYLYARRHFDAIDAQENVEIQWEIALRDTFRTLSQTRYLNLSQVLIIKQLRLMDPTGSSDAVLGWAKLAVKDTVSAALVRHSQRQQVYTDICCTVVDKVRSANYAEVFDTYMFGVSLEECWSSRAGFVDGCVNGCFIGDSDIFAVYFNLNGTNTVLHYSIGYDVMRGELHGDFLLGTSGLALEPATRGSNLSETHQLDFVL